MNDLGVFARNNHFARKAAEFFFHFGRDFEIIREQLNNNRLCGKFFVLIFKEFLSSKMTNNIA